MEENVRFQIEQSLKRVCNMEWEKLQPNIQEYLYRIENYFQNCIKTYEESITRINNINLSVRGVCEGANVSKSTVYGNVKILRIYIESRISQINQTFYSEKLKKLEDKYREVENLLNNNLEIFVQNKEIEYNFIDLQKENSILQKKINIYLEKNSTLVAENSKLKQELKLLKNVNNNITNISEIRK